MSDVHKKKKNYVATLLFFVCVLLKATQLLSIMQCHTPSISLVLQVLRHAMGELVLGTPTYAPYEHCHRMWLGNITFTDSRQIIRHTLNLGCRDPRAAMGTLSHPFSYSVFYSADASLLHCSQCHCAFTRTILHPIHRVQDSRCDIHYTLLDCPA